MRTPRLPHCIVTVLLLASAQLTPITARELQAPDPNAQPAAPLAAPAPADLLAKANAGDADAEVRLGIFYSKAKPPNFPETLKWFRQASDQGSAAGAINVGQMYAAGIGVARNPGEATKWYRLAAERGSALAKARLGQHYENGLGVPQNYAEALKWYRAAADQKDAIGQNGLGGMYALGRGITADQMEATRLFRLAANQGFVLAQANLGLQYIAGRGTGQNNTAGYFWLNLAAARLPTATSALRNQVTHARDDAAAKLAPPELARIQRLVAAWKPGSADVPAD